MTWYRIPDTHDGPAHPVACSDASAWNRRGFGIFTPINVFDGARRAENLARIRAWAIDIDDGTKEEQRERIRRSPISPSRIVETRRGYHVWFLAAEATRSTWDAIVADRLIPFFQADRAAKDLARVLRLPGFFVMKDPSAPFLVRLVERNERRYSEREMLAAFPDIGGAKRREEAAKRAQRAPHRQDLGGGDLWDRAMALDARYALERLSGHPAVGGERFTFRPTGRGKYNIVIDAREPGCWIDADGRIGCRDGAGPGVAQWLKSYGLSWGEVARVLRDVFPELEEVAA